MPQQPMILPSILAANFAHLESDIHRVVNAGATIIHLDIMDGHFVSNISFGPGIVARINTFCNATLDTHLMITNPDDYLAVFQKAGSDNIIVHIEVCSQIEKTLQKIKDLGMKAGVAINPETPIEMLEHILPFADIVLVMSVQPGFGGQTFIKDVLQKIEYLHKRKLEQNLKFVIEIDGGIDVKTITPSLNAGAEYFVTGTSIFSDGQIEANFRNLKDLIS